LIRVMNGLAGDVVRVQDPVPLDAAPASRSGLRRRFVNVLAREPFVALVVALDAVILTFRPSIFLRSDTWLSLVGGRLVWTDWLPHHDSLTVWTHGRTWVDQQWLGQLFFYWIHALGGLRLLLFVHAALLVAGFGLAVAFARRSGGSSRSVAVVGLVGLFVAVANSAARTQSFAYLFFVVLFWVLASNVKTPSRRVLLPLPLLVLWANIHGSAVLGAGLVVLWAIAEVLRAGRQSSPDAWRTRTRAAALAVAAPLCVLVSPYGVGVVGYYRDVLGSGAFRNVVSEWQAPTFPDQLPFFVLGLAALWLAARKPARLTLFEHLALICMLVAGLDAIRNMVWFALVAIMVVPRALDGVWQVREAPIRRRANLAISLSAVAVIAATFGAAASRSASSYADGYPQRAAAAVSTAAATDPSVRIFANEAFADWLLWKVPALSGRIAFDARFELLTGEQLRAIEHFRHQSSPHWLASAAGYRLLVLDPGVEKRAIRTVLAEPGVRSLYRDADVAVLLRSGRQ
jgi:hypothetical protein